MKLKIKSRRLVKIGNSWGFLVDMAYIKNGQIQLEGLYDICITEAEESE